jgi:hypothetical protein
MIYFNLKKTFIIFLSSLLSLLSFAQNQSVAYTVFQPGVISSAEYSEGSPGITADGQTMVFTRYKSYGKQVPYIATKTRDSWYVERWPVIDTLYNLAISPDGDRIVYKVRREAAGEVSYATYQVDRSGEGWGRPRQLPGPLFANAGYFRIARDGTLYMYINNAAGNDKGIYLAEPDGTGSYQSPEWLSDAVSPHSSTTYTPIPNADETKLIVNRAGLAGKSEELLGPRGLFLHQKHGDQWDAGVPVTGIPYTYYAMVTPDDHLIFVEDGDLYQIPLSATNIAFSESSQLSQLARQLTAVELAFAKKGWGAMNDIFTPRSGIAENGEIVASGLFQMRNAFRDTTRQAVAFTSQTLDASGTWADIRSSEIWQNIPRSDRPVPLGEIELDREEGGLYELAKDTYTYLQDGKRQVEKVFVIRYWIEQWGETLVQAASYSR